MTREEAIELLVNATYSDEWQGNEELTTAHNMAIEALKREPCEDAISRKAVINLILEDAVRTGTEHRYTSNQNMNNEINEVRSLPPVKPIHKLVNVQIKDLKKWKRIINGLPDGYLMPPVERK